MHTDDSIDFEGVLNIEQLGKFLQANPETIRRRVLDGVFPIPTLDGVDNRHLRWSGPVVRRWLEQNGNLGQMAPAPARRRRQKKTTPPPPPATEAPIQP